MAQVPFNGQPSMYHTHGAIHDALHPDQESCMDEVGCHQHPNQCAVDDCRHIGNTVLGCVWNAELAQFDCFHAVS